MCGHYASACQAVTRLALGVVGLDLVSAPLRRQTLVVWLKWLAGSKFHPEYDTPCRLRDEMRHWASSVAIGTAYDLALRRALQAGWLPPLASGWPGKPTGRVGAIRHVRPSRALHSAGWRTHASMAAPCAVEGGLSAKHLLLP